MHELSLAMAIVEQVAKHCAESRVTRVAVEVGVLGLVAVDSLRFSFQLAAEGTLLEGAELAVTGVPGRGRCRTCGSGVDVGTLLDRCGCGSADVEIESGLELRISSVEVI